MASLPSRASRAWGCTHFLRIPRKAFNFPTSSGDLSTAAVGTDLVVSADLAEAVEGAGDGLAV